MENKKEPKMFDTINMDDIVKANDLGYLYVTTTPSHPYGEKRKDRKKRYIYLHRAVMEKHLGRYLKPTEQVDHIDKDKTNNDISNLELKERGPHQRDHALSGKGFWKKSPRNKKNWGKKASSDMMHRVILRYFSTGS
jgi:hypothetical protein